MILERHEINLSGRLGVQPLSVLIPRSRLQMLRHLFDLAPHA